MTLRTSLALAFAAFSLAACQRHIDATKVEHSIQTELQGKGVDLRSLKCPKNEPIKQGATFDCEAVDAQGQTLVIHVDQSDQRGTISWKLDGMIIDTKKVGDSIEQKVGASSDVQCSGGTRILRVNESFECDATIAGRPHKVSITLTDKEGSVSWKVVK